ncbi:HPr-rel-A system PqqD family peptide chaperone [Parasphingopyxis marina]|uniref:HPr-rel-A system PqqD family peptide chaperone n=1 Tax=Parasphingopyxis marina TaxID=2761622 RepID=A0A842I0N2_9SPHN|nr:HPr-rel-A system PqqD family peptide chaperone [Parasphingopyxis marina]MBC2777314.1 HPr-rel-A system PqqD family peptide chaperone [Parasphingopyxis marina]
MPAPVYRADPEKARRIVQLDSVTLIFHRASGLTHIVAPPAPEILAALAEGDADAATLLDRLKRDFDFGEDEELEAALSARLAELETAGLVWRP